MKVIWLKILSLSLLCIIVFTACSSRNQKVVSLEVWHHYEGAQKIAFDKQVTEFNETEGIVKGIIVEAFSQGSVKELEMKVMNTVNNQIGSGEVPDIFSAYPDIAHKMDKMELVVNLEDYIKKGDIKNYEDIYVEEGYMGKNHELKMFPIAKSTEILMVNKTDWDKFSIATSTNIKEIETWEGLARVAEKYYNWTNWASSKPDDGKAFFARDDMVNYMLAGSYQLGERIFEVDDDIGSVQINNEIMKKLWDNYYIPYINGYYGPFNRFSSDDLKTGKIICYVASTAEANYFPKKVTTSSGESYEIEPLMLPVPNFANTKPSAVLQGAGMVVLKSDEAHEKSAVEFLKWFTKTSNNMTFSLTTGYLPVAKGLGNQKAVERELANEKGEHISSQVRMSLPVAAKQMEEYDIYINKAFNNSAAARDVLTASLMARAKGDRAKVLALMEEGMSRKQAVASIATDNNFEQWVVRLKMEVRGVVR